MSIESTSRATDFIPEQVKPEEVFIGLDLDRFLLSVEKTYELLHKTTAELYPEFVEKLNQEKSKVEDDGGSFNPIAMMEEALGADETQDILAAYVHNARKNPNAYLEDGALELIETLKGYGANYGIITYTTDQRWSKAKLDGSLPGDINVLMTDSKDKRGLMLSWLDRNTGTFNVPQELGGRAAAWVLFGDDKAKVVEDFSLVDQMGGWWYASQPDGLMLPSQRPSKAIPPHVARVGSLRQINEEITELYT